MKNGKSKVPQQQKGEAAILKALDEIWREGKIGQITEKEKKKLEKAAFLEMQSKRTSFVVGLFVGRSRR